MPDKNKTLREGAIKVSGWNLDSSTQTQMYLNALAKHYGFSMTSPSKICPRGFTTCSCTATAGRRSV